MSALDRHGLAQNTPLIVDTDTSPLGGSLAPGARESTATVSNGRRYAGDLRGFKASIYEGGHRVPFIARRPEKIPAGGVGAQPASLVDLLATVAAIVGAKLSDDDAVDSLNMLAALEGTAGADRMRAAIVHHPGSGAFALRDGRWKIVFGQGEDRVQPTEGTGYLFDLRAGPRETKNVWQEHPEVVARLAALLEACQAAGRSVDKR